MDEKTPSVPDSAALDSLGLLQDPKRQALYRCVVAAGQAVSREDAAKTVGVGRTLAAFHLDKLAEAGLLKVSFGRKDGRGGPGAGRPAKLYQRAETAVTVSLPPQAYETAARLLAETVERAGADALLTEVARRSGAERGRAARAEAGAGADSSELLERVLEQDGYEPAAGDPVVRLRNCPFHQLVGDFQPLVCAMNLARVEGLVGGLGAAEAWAAEPDSGPGRCCVMLAPADASNNNIR